MDYRLHTGDNVEFLKTLDSESIDLTVTSPPYDNLRTYNGYEWDFESLVHELYRVTKKGGVVVWVVGDATIKGSETLTSFKQAIYFKDMVGFNVHDTMIYKKNNKPLTHNRYEQEFEYMFVLSKKGAKVKCNHITIPSVQGGRVRRKATMRHRTADGELSYMSEGKVKASSEKIKGNVWEFKTGYGGTSRDKIKHPAQFPESLARDHVLSWSDEGDTVLDPFMGSGTTGKMAMLTGRNFIGCDISDEYVEVARSRIEKATGQMALFDEVRKA